MKGAVPLWLARWTPDQLKNMIYFKMFSNTFTYLFSSTRRLSPKPSVIVVLLMPLNSLKVIKAV